MFASVVSAGCSLFGVRAGYEQPAYDVVDRIGDAVEIRRYAPRLAAEAIVEAPDEDAGRNAAFRVLFDYISGANRGGAKIAMTTPVSVAAAPETIAMTAPVQAQRVEGGGTAMRFFLPAAYARETAPEPTDPRVRIVEVPEETLAVLRYSGFRDRGSIAARRAELVRALADGAWEPAGEPFDLFYDPPWTLPFLRRNEAAVRVEAASRS